MGGIGKTSLARAAVDHCLEENLFEAVIWEPRPSAVSVGSPAPQSWADLLVAIGRQLGAPDLAGLPETERPPRLAALLGQHRVLLVLDSLESAVLNQDDLVSRIMPLLQGSKAVFTSRRRFKSDLFGVHLAGLDEESAGLLIRSEAQEKGLRRVEEASSSDLRSIGRATGGSPLAIKLVVGQLQHLPLYDVLRSLQEVTGAVADEEEDEYVKFYKAIFWGSWKLLSDDAQRLLISMAVFAPGIGGTFGAIEKTSGLDREPLARTLDQLWRLSFVETGDPKLRNPRYHLHALTQYFVVSDIVKPPV